MVRAAGWPIEMIAGLRSTPFTRLVDRWLDREEMIRHEAEQLSQCLYALVPRIREKSLRAAILSFRRCIHRTTGPVPESLQNAVLSTPNVPLHLNERIRSHCSARASLAAEKEELTLAYRSSRDIERNALRRIANDPLFRKALYIASPTAYLDLATAGTNISARRLGRLERTLYSYVMRAVGRPTPNGLWAAVAREVQAPCQNGFLSVDWQSPGRVVFSPDLSPFLMALRTLAKHEPWRSQITFRLNPTLFKDASSAWYYEDFRDGTWQVFQMPDHPILDTVVTLCGDGAARPAKMIEDYLVYMNTALSTVHAERVVNELLALGILWSTVVLPGIYDDSCQALSRVAVRVPKSERPHWEDCLHTLKAICRQLSLTFWSLPENELCEHMASARRCVNRLLAHYGVEPLPEESQALIADRVAPFRFSIAPQLRAKVYDAVKAYWIFDRYGMGQADAAMERERECKPLNSAKHMSALEFFREWEQARIGAYIRRADVSGAPAQHLEEQTDGVTDSGNSWEEMLAAMDKAPVTLAAQAGLARWHHELEVAHRQRCHHLRIAPTDTAESLFGPGSALIQLAFSDHGPVIRVGGVTPDPCLLHARFSHVLREHGEKTDSFARWFRESLRHSEALFPKLHFADLAAYIQTNPNAASRPRMSKRILDPLHRDEHLLSSACLRLDATGRPKLYRPGQSSVILPGLHSAVSMDSADPYSRCLHLLWQSLGRPSLMRPLPRLNSELHEWHHLPRLFLDDTIVISPERWTPPPAVRAALAMSSELDRYVVWRRFVRAMALPELVYGQYGLQQSHMLLAVDSILGVEHLGHALASHGGSFVVQEAFPTPWASWVCDAGGQHYVAELAIAWQGEAAFWRDYVDDGEHARSDSRVRA